ncbi:MAG: hypothetical protein ACRC0G_05905 [Fusobacteriaceae bacterium]
MQKLIRFEESLKNYYEDTFGGWNDVDFDKTGIYHLFYTTNEQRTEEYDMNYDFNSQEIVWLVDDKEVFREYMDSDSLFDYIVKESIFDHCGTDV